MKQFKLLAQGHPRLRIQLRWPGFNIFTCSVSVSFLPGVPFFRNSLPPCCVVFWGLSGRGHALLCSKASRWSRSLYPVNQNPERNSTVMVGPVHSCDRCTRNSHLFLHSTLPRPLWGSPCRALLLQAAPLSCARPSGMGRWMQGNAIGSHLLGRRGAGPDGSQPRPCQCLPSGTQNSLTCLRISSRAQPSGVQRPGPLGSVWVTITAISGPEPCLGSAESSAAVTVQLLLPAAFPPSQAWLLWPLAVYLLSADLYLRVQRMRPKTAALTTLLQPAARDP